MIINGKELAERIKEQIRQEIKLNNLKIKLAVVMVGENPASKIYVNNKIKACKEVGIESLQFVLEKTTQDKLNTLLEDLSKAAEIDAILLQLPLPEGLSAKEALSHIASDKDVDGLTKTNLGALAKGEDGIIPCTARAVLYIAQQVTETEGKNVVVVGRSELVGLPTALLFSKNNATVTVCHSKTKELIKHTKTADILVSAVGKPCLITKQHIKKGAIVIDVGINKTNGKLCGDVDFEKVKNKAAYITPVPNGVGPMTVAMLLLNAVNIAKNRLN